MASSRAFLPKGRNVSVWLEEQPASNTAAPIAAMPLQPLKTLDRLMLVSIMSLPIRRIALGF